MKKTAIGGSALMEGLMMIGPENAAIAIRMPDGEIHIEDRKIPVKGRLDKIPVFRGIVSFFRQMVLSIKAMMFSVEFIDLDGKSEEETSDKKTLFDHLLDRIFGEKLKDAVVTFSLVLSLAFSIGLFILVPNIVAGLLHFDKNSYWGVMYYNLFEGVLKVSLFLGYLILATRMKDIRRVWEYHGAEHKTINCYEHEEELTVANVMKYTTKNPRCGTSYMFLVILVSILLFSLLGWYSIWFNVLIRLMLMPLVAGLTFELFRFAGRSNSILAQILSRPGLWFQLLTTKEPDEKQVEVAILAFNKVRPKDAFDIIGDPC